MGDERHNPTPLPTPFTPQELKQRDPQPPEPSDFDQWERAGNQELKLMTTLADVEAKHAQTLHQYAQTANLEEATRAAQAANEQAEYIKHQVRRRDYEVRQKLKQIEGMRPGLQILKEGRVVSDKTVASVWQSFSWFIGNTPAGKWSGLYGAECEITTDDYVRVLKKEPTPFTGKTLGAVLAWLSHNFMLPAAGASLHLKILALLAALESTEGERAAALEAWQDKIHTASQEELKTVRELLQISLKAS